MRLARTAVSYVPSPSLLSLRSLRDLGLRRMPHEADFLAFRHLPAGAQVFLDVGANRGQSIRSIGLVLESVRIVAVEPNPILAKALQAASNTNVVSVHNVALSDQAEGQLTLHVPRYGHTLYDTRAAASPDAARGFLNDNSFVRFSQGRASVETYAAPLATIDGLAVDPTIIKIDVEGADGPVVAGGLATIERARPILLIEEPTERSLSLLAALDYTAYRYDGESLVANSLSGLNTFFLRAEHEAAFIAGGLPLS
ncbi:MAG: FkbM family methyltransferase [Acidimicrobiales bacterium]|jgi:FkbM family methyltransferase